MPDQTFEYTKWLWSLLIIPISWFTKLIWDTHMKQQDIRVAMEQQKREFEEMLHEHQQWVSKEHPTKQYFDQRLEDIITPIQLSVLENNRDMKEQGKKLDSILLHIVKDKS